MRRRSQYAVILILAAVLVAGAAGTAWAISNPYISYIFCPDWPYTNQLKAEVTTNTNGTYHYLYTLNYLQTSFDEPLTDFSIGNPDNLAYSNPGCTYAFTMNTSTHDSIYWYVDYGAATVGHTVKFWFDSPYSYCLRDITIGSGLPSNGYTLGLVAPEPAGVFAALFGMAGLLPLVRRKR